MRPKAPWQVLRPAAVAAALLAGAGSADAAPIDLSTWTKLTLDFPGGQSAGNWTLEPGNTAVRQTVNADPSFYLKGSSDIGYRMQGSWEVYAAGGDNDYMGFVFGYQNSSNFYLFDWKAGSQSSGPALAEEGMTIKKFEGATGNGLADLSIAEFWENASDYGDMTVLAKNHSSTAGWVPGTLYDFLLEYNIEVGKFRIKVSQGATTLWDTTVSDSTFGAGMFGFYNNSQGGVRYAGFEQDIIPPTDPGEGEGSVPEPASLVLLGLGLTGAAARSRRRNANV